MPIAIASTLLNFIPRLIISVALSSVILWFLSRRFDFTDKSYKTALTSSIVAGSASAVVLFAIVALVDALVQPSNFAGGIGVLVYSVVPGVIAAVLIYFIALNFFYKESLKKILGITAAWIILISILNNLINPILNLLLSF